jgi:CRISPR-associated protein Cmr6
MTFAKAFQRAKAQKGETIDMPDTQTCETNPQEIPMMYRAQISGRCSLQYAGSEDDRDRWTDEWLYPQSNDSQPRHQHPETLEDVIETGHFCRLKISFPWRVFTNCGQDSIARPVWDIRGIPHIPGSSIKGLFRRECQKRDRGKPESERLTTLYCGDKDNLKPSRLHLRFHGAYPLGDWAGTVEVGAAKKTDGTSNTDKPTYRLVDVVHPQEDWQMGIGKPPKKKSANALISLYKPTLVFEISSGESLSLEQWKAIAGILKTALRQGLGGKTSSGYGLAYPPKNQYDFSAYLIGKGMAPVLLGKDPEFRPNLFKAALRGHTRRLLAGYSPDADRLVGHLFGSTRAPARVEIYWDTTLPQTPKLVYEVKGTLRISIPGQKERELIEAVLKFAYTMGGFGKSWRRVWHKMFYRQSYDKDIGCHWEADEDWLNKIKTPNELTVFLDSLEKICQRYCGSNTTQPVDWRETWHRQRVAVYTVETERSQAIELFHDSTFKTTPAIGGKTPKDDRPKYVSSVWHRMLPIGENELGQPR